MSKLPTEMQSVYRQVRDLQEVNAELLICFKRLVERIDFNGGLGEYKGGPSFVMKDAREVILKAEAKSNVS